MKLIKDLFNNTSVIECRYYVTIGINEDLFSWIDEFNLEEIISLYGEYEIIDISKHIGGIDIYVYPR